VQYSFWRASKCTKFKYKKTSQRNGLAIKIYFALLGKTRDIIAMNYGHKQHPYVAGHIARFLLCRHGPASVPACLGVEICRERTASSCIALLVDSDYVIITG